MNKNMDNQINLAIDKILKSKNVYIASHVQPDGDSLGSSIALGLALKKVKEEVYLLKVDETPRDFLFLPGVNMISDLKGNENIDLLIAVDTSDANRLGVNEQLINRSQTVINIDHHISNTNFGHINIVDGRASATGELIYKIINEMNIKIDKDIATNIYTALSTDTGSFMYDNTSSQTHRIAAELIDKGADTKNININIYQNKSLEKTNLLINTLSNLDMYFQNQVAIVKVTKDILTTTGTTMEDTEGIISFIRDIDSVEIAILLKEIEDEEIKVSMRSKRFADVSKICSAFNGGGHKKAAGCTIYKSIAEADQLLLNEIKKVL